jgi:hypothetical protein
MRTSGHDHRYLLIIVLLEEGLDGRQQVMLRRFCRLTCQSDPVRAAQLSQIEAACYELFWG